MRRYENKVRKFLSNDEKSSYLKVLLMLTSTMAFDNGDSAAKKCKPSSRYSIITIPTVMIEPGHPKIKQEPSRFSGMALVLYLT
jgi:hypothetical protein